MYTSSLGSYTITDHQQHASHGMEEHKKALDSSRQLANKKMNLL